MVTITPRKKVNGQTVYRAEVRRFEDKKLIFKRSRTFDTQRAAKQWAEQLEAALAQPGAIENAKAATLTIAVLIETYLRRMAEIKPPGRSIQRTLEAIARGPLGAIPAARLISADLVDFCRHRKTQGAGPPTLLLDITTLGTVFARARPILGLPLTDDVFKATRPMLMEMGLMQKPRKRTRRPSETEIERLLAHFRKRAQHTSSLIPMEALVRFAVASCMRLGEITGLLWTDLDKTRRTVIIRNRKAPRGKEGNDQEVPLLGEAWEIVQAQPRDQARIFPYDPQSVSAAFTRTCRQIGIPDLHFHDLRREGISRLAERGFSTLEIAAVSGHQTLDILHTVYTRIDPGKLHERFDR
jgi:integrase